MRTWCTECSTSSRDSDLAGLDREEGVHLGGYARRSLRLRLPNGGTTDAMTYIAGEPYIDASCLPFDWYRDLVVAGAREHRLPPAYLRELERTPAVPDPDSARWAGGAGAAWATAGRAPSATPPARLSGPRRFLAYARTLTIGTGSFRIWPWTTSLAAGASVGSRWISSSTSMPRTTRPNVA